MLRKLSSIQFHKRTFSTTNYQEKIKVILPHYTPTNVRINQNSLDIKWVDGSKQTFGFNWLRDHCQCSSCYHPVTAQRQFDTLKLPENMKVIGVKQNLDGFSVMWSENSGSSSHESVYPYKWLHNCLNDPFERSRLEPKLWTSADLEKKKPTVNYSEVMEDDKALFNWLNLIQTYGFAIVKGVPTDVKLNRKLIERISYIRENIYGSMWDFTADMAMSDTAYTNIELLPHTDGCYLKDPPGLQVFHLTHHEGTGGQSLIVDGFKVMSDLREVHPEIFDFFVNTPIPFHYIDKNNYLFDKKTVVELDSQGRLHRFNINNDDRSPINLPKDKVDTFYSYLRLLLQMTRDPKYMHEFQLDAGNLMITNNWRVLHGRRSFTGSRRLVGCYVNYEDYRSRIITLQRKLEQEGKIPDSTNYYSEFSQATTKPLEKTESI